jgi:hypothetical protein
MSTHHTLHWTSADRQATIDMTGEYDSADHADATREAVADLLGQCGSLEEEAGILAGTITGTGEQVADILRS